MIMTIECPFCTGTGQEFKTISVTEEACWLCEGYGLLDKGESE